VGDGYEPCAVSAEQLTRSETGEAMNRGFYIILVPAALVAIGYLVVFRYIGVSPAYWRLILPVVLFAGAMWWLARRTARKTGSSAP
jgi:ABC-type glycerol-3-phosphate transport system permease component